MCVLIAQQQVENEIIADFIENFIFQINHKNVLRGRVRDTISANGTNLWQNNHKIPFVCQLFRYAANHIV